MFLYFSLLILNLLQISEFTDFPITHKKRLPKKIGRRFYKPMKTNEILFQNHFMY